MILFKNDKLAHKKRKGVIFNSLEKKYFRWFSLISQHIQVGLRAQNQAKNLRLAELYRFVVESSGLDSREPRKVKLKVAHSGMYFMWSRVQIGCR